MSRAEDDETARRAGPREPEAAPQIWFPDVPRLELEQVIEQLTARAQDVLAAQGRLRHLLRANAAVVADLSLPALLPQIVTSARTLVQARYAALGVVRDGVIEELVHEGMDAEDVDRIGHPPRGEGLLGLLVEHPEPVRVADLTRHPRSVGVPEGHPRMRSFLGVPIRVRDEVFGHLYLTDSANGEFSVDDEQLDVALATTAGVAIANSRLYEETERQRRWLSASSELTRELFEESSDSAYAAVLRHAVEGAQADSAAFVLAEPHGGLRVLAAKGWPVGDLVGQIVDGTDSLAARVIASGEAVLTEHYGVRFRPPGGAVPVDAALRVATAVGVPLRATARTTAGALVLGRTPGRRRFTTADRDQLGAFATQAGVALQLEQARRDRTELRLLEDHDRIAADLHGHVIQQLFAVGMGLAAMVERVPGEEHKQRLTEYLDSLDETIERIRDTVLALRQENPPGPPADGS